MKGLIELVITVAVAVVLALLIQAFIVKPYRIPSGSMIPTLDISQRILVNRLDGNPSIGDVVVFHPPAGADLPGGRCAATRTRDPDTDRRAIPRPRRSPARRSSSASWPVPATSCRSSTATCILNGVPEKDSYIVPCGAVRCNFPDTDQDSARRLLHDGGQPWRLGRQPLLGPRAEQMDHRCRVLHLLAAGPDRLPLAASTGTATVPCAGERRPRAGPQAVQVRPRAGCALRRGRRRGRPGLPGRTARGRRRAVRPRADRAGRGPRAGGAQRLQAADARRVARSSTR